MKKLLLTLTLGVSLCVNAQLTVFENGNVQLGNSAATYNSSYGTLDVSRLPNGSTNDNEASGSITFGISKGAIINGCGGKAILKLFGGNRLEFGSSEFYQAFVINGSSMNISACLPIKAPSFLTSSDARSKSNVETLSEVYSKLREVNSVSYNLKTDMNPNSATMTAKTSDTKPRVVDDRTHFGFIAQEIQKIYPNLVVEDEEGMLAIDYTGFIPLLVEAYKNLSVKVSEQEEMIDALLAQKSPSYMPASVNGLAESKASLKQNKPNPFNSTTTIECTVPQCVASAFICVYDLQGKQLHRIDIRERGEIANVIDASYFTPGMYIYALIADGVEIDSKRMIITD